MNRKVDLTNLRHEILALGPGESLTIQLKEDDIIRKVVSNAYARIQNIRMKTPNLFYKVSQRKEAGIVTVTRV